MLSPKDQPTDVCKRFTWSDRDQHSSKFVSFPQHTSHSNGRQEIGTRSARTGLRTRGSEEPQPPHVGNYRLLKTIGKGNFAKVKLARHILTGREVSRTLLYNTLKKLPTVLFPSIPLGTNQSY